MSLDGKMIDTHGKRSDCIGEFKRPSVCMNVSGANLIVADCFNNRLQLLHGNQWSELQLQPPPYWPCNAVYDGDALYVVQMNPNSLVKYE